MPILINELHTEVLEPEQEEDTASEQAAVTGMPMEWLKMDALRKERQARLEDD